MGSTDVFLDITGYWTCMAWFGAVLLMSCCKRFSFPFLYMVLGLLVVLCHFRASAVLELLGGQCWTLVALLRVVSPQLQNLKGFGWMLSDVFAKYYPKNENFNTLWGISRLIYIFVFSLFLVLFFLLKGSFSDWGWLGWAAPRSSSHPPKQYIALCFVALSLAFPVYPLATETVYRSNSYGACCSSDCMAHRALFFWANQLMLYF